MRDVIVAGVGVHKFGKFMDKSLKELGRVAVWHTLEDSGFFLEDIFKLPPPLYPLPLREGKLLDRLYRPIYGNHFNTLRSDIGKLPWPLKGGFVNLCFHSPQRHRAR